MTASLGVSRLIVQGVMFCRFLLARHDRRSDAQIHGMGHNFDFLVLSCAPCLTDVAPLQMLCTRMDADAEGKHGGGGVSYVTSLIPVLVIEAITACALLGAPSR